MSIDWRGRNPPAGVAKYAKLLLSLRAKLSPSLVGNSGIIAISGTSEDAHDLNEFKTIHLQSCYTSVLAINTQAGNISIFIDSAIEFSRTSHVYSSIKVVKYLIEKGGLPNEHLDRPSLLLRDCLTWPRSPSPSRCASSPALTDGIGARARRWRHQCRRVRIAGLRGGCRERCRSVPTDTGRPVLGSF